MLVLARPTRPLKQQTPPAPNPEAAKEKINQALELLGQSRLDNHDLNEVYEEAEKALEGYEPHVKAIEFDRGTRDVSEHGTALREKAAGATETLGTGEEDYQSVEGKNAQMIELVEGALADIGSSNTKAEWRLTSSLNDLMFVKDSSLRGLDMALHRSTRLLGEELDPYLVEVEEDAPGRDVGRHADDIEEIWLSTDQQLEAGPVYSRSVERSYESANGYLIRAREAL